jgi:hypothetical protein
VESVHLIGDLDDLEISLMRAQQVK